MKTKVLTLGPEEMVQFYKIFCNIYVGLWKTRKYGEFSTSRTCVKITSLHLLPRDFCAQRQSAFLLPWHCRTTNTAPSGFSKQHKGAQHLDPTEFQWTLDMRVFSFPGADSLPSPSWAILDEVKGLF